MRPTLLSLNPKSYFAIFNVIESGDLHGCSFFYKARACKQHLSRPQKPPAMIDLWKTNQYTRLQLVKCNGLKRFLKEDSQFSENITSRIKRLYKPSFLNDVDQLLVHCRKSRTTKAKLFQEAMFFVIIFTYLRK